MKIISVVGARPNFMKVAPISRQFSVISRQYSRQKAGQAIEHLICHTGQHYDEKMSKVFFDELELPKPDFYLGIGNGSHAEQTGRVMIEFEKVLQKEKPDLVIVVGDVNSTIACSLAAVKLGIKVAHVEAGLRSFDRTMPEEINRILTDSISDYLFVTEKSGVENLKREGIPDGKIFFVGNCMIDSLVNYLPKINSSQITNYYLLSNNNYIVVTFHRPSNVDSL
ncbi:MAG: UDP-N-acetyl glucosamine 2-epimerase [Melioribacteraceae bacterium]